ncbi:MAG: LysE family translocator, partial [Undibacterium sp.]|nr:LysE family translocator [Undibacterium sp.]
GLAAGGICHALLAALGLSVIITEFPQLLQSIRILGAIYLTYLAYDALKSALQTQQNAMSNMQNEPVKSASGANKRWINLFFNGFLIELSNPKTIIFFLSFMPQFASDNSTTSMFLLSALIPITAIPADLLAIFAGTFIARQVQPHYWLVRATNLTVAAVLFSIAILILFS